MGLHRLLSQDSPEQIPWQIPGAALEFSTGQASCEFFFKKFGRPDVGSSQQGIRGRATGGRDARIGIGAGWAMNPETLGKDTYNPALPPHAWGYI